MQTKRLTPWLVFAIALAGCNKDQSEFERLQERERQSQAKPDQSRDDIDKQLESVKREIDLGSPQRALEMSREILLQHPSNEDALVMSAQAQAAAGDKTGAAELLQSIASDNVDRKASWALQASQWLVQSGQFEAAIDTLRKFVSQHPEQSRVRRQLAVQLNQSGLRLEAAEHLHWLLKSQGLSEKELFALISLRNALIDSTLEAPSEKSLAPIVLSRAMDLHDRGQSNEALQLAISLSKKHPDNPNIVAFTGRVLSELQMQERFLQWRDGLQVDLPFDITRQPDYWYAIGLADYRQEKYETATRCFGECLRLDPTDRDAAIHFARALNFIGNTEASEQAVSRYEKLDRIVHLASDIGAAKGTADQYHEIADLLDELGRRWEALGWRSFAVSSAGVKNEQAIAKLEMAKKQLSDMPVLDPSEAICGLDLTKLPLPESSKIDLAAKSPGATGPLPSSGQKPDLDVRLVDVASALGIDFWYRNGDDPSDDQFLLHQQTGGGIGAIDFDLDGWQDLYFVQAGGGIPDQNDSQPDQLCRNLAGREFRQVTNNANTENLGYGQGVDIADLNQDGFADILVANIGRNAIWINNGDGTFQKADLPSEADGMWTTSIASGDLDGDHLPEIIEVNYIDDPIAFVTPCVPTDDMCGPSRFRPAADRWLSVNPEGRIERWAGEPDQTEIVGHGFAAIITNVDSELGNDVYVANDSDANWFWKSRSLGKRDIGFSPLEESGQLAGSAAGDRGGRHGSMGLAAADWDRNGALDLHITNYWDQAADFYLQIQKGVFQHATQSWQFVEGTKPTVGWGTQAIDLNQDGWDDLVVMNGHIVDRSSAGIPFQMLPQVFVQAGSQWREATSNAATSDSYWSSPALGRSLCRVDIDRDGRSDLVAGHLDRPIVILRNETPARNWVRFTLVGVESERDAIGARLEVQCGQRTLVGWQIGGGGFLCDNQAVVEFGLGDCETLTRVDVTWPSGQKQRFENLDACKHYQLIEGQSLVQEDRTMVPTLQ
ncbi:MAG: FG-GAP-like repeat-containing protein [Rubripirellula sp.]